MPNDVWSSDLIISEHIDIELPASILALCNILRAHTSDNEFSVLCKGSWFGNVYKVSHEYVIPIQEVDRCSVYYNDNDLHQHRSAGYNVVIHCHPFKSNWFSNTDATTINAHFECSVLYSEGSFTTAIVPIQVTDSFTLQVKPKTIMINWNEVCDVDITNIIQPITILHYKGDNVHDNVGNSEQLTLFDVSKVIDANGYVVIVDIDGEYDLIPYNELPSNVVYNEDFEAFVITDVVDYSSAPKDSTHGC